MSALINIADVSARLVRTIQEHPDCIGYFKSVERGEYANKDPARAPWCGVYRTAISYAPHVLGNHNRSWRAGITVKLVVQAHDATGEKTEDMLEEAVHKAMTAVLGDLNLAATVNMLKSISIEYSYDETDSSTLDFQWAFITLEYEARTGV
jgi:hypothetical protein